MKVKINWIIAYVRHLWESRAQLAPTIQKGAKSHPVGGTPMPELTADN